MPSLSSASTTSHSPSPNAALRADLVDLAADHEARLPARAAQDQREHRRGRGLAVRSGDRDRAPRRRERGERGRAVQHRDAELVARRRARRSVRGIAVEYTTASASAGTCSARLPTCTSTPAAASRSSTAVLLMSEPLTVWPMRASTQRDRAHARAADADDVHAARPRQVERRHRDRRRASGGTGVLLDEIGDARRRVGPAEPARGRAHLARAGRSRRAAPRRRASSRGGSHSASGSSTAAPARSSVCALRVW